MLKLQSKLTYMRGWCCYDSLTLWGISCKTTSISNRLNYIQHYFNCLFQPFLRGVGIWYCNISSSIRIFFDGSMCLLSFDCFDHSIKWNVIPPSKAKKVKKTSLKGLLCIRDMNFLRKYCVKQQKISYPAKTSVTFSLKSFIPSIQRLKTVKWNKRW